VVNILRAKIFMKPKAVWIIIGGFFWLAGCVQPQQVDLIEREQRRLRGDTSQVQTSLDTVRADVNSVRSSLADTRANLQQLQREFGTLREKIEETRHVVGRQIGESTRGGDQRVKELEARVGKLSESLKAQEATLQAQDAALKAREDELKQLRESLQTFQNLASSTRSEPPVMDSSAGENAAIKRDYEQGWQAMERRDYRVAISRFKEFLKKHPKSNLADNAQYWIGESHYGLREFDQAIIEFDAVRRRYPQGEKVPAALLKQGYAFAELGEKLNARLLLQEVIEKYPDAPEAAKAKLRLKSLES
jgi:tol-pal system protein YbgF